jgi:O-antigen ligase
VRATAAERRESWLCALLYASVFFGSSLAILGSIALGVPSRSLTVMHRGLVLLLAFVSILGFAFRPAKTYRGWARVALVVFWFLYVVRIVLERGAPDLPMPPAEYFVFAIGVCLLPTLGFARYFSDRALRHAFWAVTASGAAAAIISIWLFGSTIGTSFGRLRRGEQIGEFVATNPLQFSYLGSALILLGVYLFFDPTHTRTSARRGLLIAGLLGVGTFPLLLGASRGAAVSVVVVSVVLGLSRSRRSTAAFNALLTLGTLSIALLVYAEALGTGLFERLGESGSGELRVQIYAEAFRKFWENPLLGDGLFVEKFNAHPHNLLLEGFMTTGFVGGMCLVVFIVACFHRAVLMLYRGSPHGWVAVLFLHYLVGAQFSSSVVLNGLLWASAGGVFGASRGITGAAPDEPGAALERRPKGEES